jgi:hypothetical protein
VKIVIPSINIKGFGMVLPKINSVRFIQESLSITIKRQ